MVKSQILNGTGTLQGTNISPSKGTFEDVVPFLQVKIFKFPGGYIFLQAFH